jgi:type I restriction enzyme S subunit
MKNDELKNTGMVERNNKNHVESDYGWKKYRISDIGRVVTGRTPPSSKPQCFGDKYPFVTPSDMDGRKKAGKTERYLSDEGADLLKGNLVPPKSVAVSCIGWQMGKSIMISCPSFTNQQLNTIIPNEKVDADFLYYSLSTRRKELLSLGATTGVRTPILNKSIFSNLEIILPPLLTQRKISAILSAYDDLIINNTQRMKIIEEIAQMLYREWFVKFRFPGNENVKMVNAELGLMPNGWEVKTVDDLVAVKSGFAFSSKIFNKNGKLGLVTIKNVQDGIFIQECLNKINEPLQIPDYCYLSAGDILLSLTGNIGRVCMVYGEDYLLNQRVAKLLPLDSRNRAMVYFMFRQIDMQKRLETIANGVAQQNLSPVQTGRLKIVMPEPNLLTRFSELCEIIIDQILMLLEKNANLRRTQDLLLQKLISGEVDVEKLDINIPTEAS